MADTRIIAAASRWSRQADPRSSPAEPAGGDREGAVRYPAQHMPDVPQTRSTTRQILTAELLAIGTELTVGETLDTNSGELARSLVAHGVSVGRIHDLPDDLGVVVDALRTALGRADLVVTTGGLGPTPDDLTREAVAEVCGEAVTVDEQTLGWLRGLWARRRQPFPSTNVKQAWVIPSATVLANPNGTAPGWLVDRPDGRVIVTLPGPPREMRPMWVDQALPRLAARGVGVDTEVRTFRLTGIGESQVAEQLGETLLRAANPIVATYARHEAVDIRISARTADGRTAAELADDAEAVVLAAMAGHVWARGDTTWAGALGEALATRGWSLATVEVGTEGAVVGLLRGLASLVRAEVLRGNPPERHPAGPRGDAGPADAIGLAEAVSRAAGADVGLAVVTGVAGADTAVRVGVVTPETRHAERRVAFLRGNQAADRAAIAGAAVLLEVLRGKTA
jgi:nicotinamide-nucleotide amidase